MYDALYVRQSVDRPDSISTTSQLEFCRYELRGGEAREYIDKGYSGKNTDRPDFQRLIQDIKKGEIKRVIVYKLDRISRSILDFATMMELFQQYNVEFVSSTEKFDTSTPMGRAMLNICIVFAQLERETIQKRVTDAYVSRSEKGFYMGGRVPYGFEITETSINGIKTKMYQAIPEEAEIIKLIYSLYANPTTSYGDILDYFLENNIKRNGNLWTRHRIADVLKNPIYVKADLSIYEFYKEQGAIVVNNPTDFVGTNGCYYYKGDTIAPKAAELKDNKIILALHEGIIEPNVWLMCRKKCLENKQIQPGRKAYNTWLAGLVKCGRCGYSLSFKKYKTKRARYLLCSRKMNSKACEGAGTIYADEFEQMIFNEIVSKLEIFQTLSINENKHTNPRVNEINIELQMIESEINKLIDKLSEANDILMSYINNKIKELDKRKQALKTESEKLSINKIDEKKVIHIKQGISKWDSISNADKNEIARALIERITATSELVEITWKI